MLVWPFPAAGLWQSFVVQKLLFETFTRTTRWCHGVTEGETNKHWIYELHLSFSAPALATAEFSVLLKAGSSWDLGHSSFTVTAPAGLHSQFCLWFLTVFLCFSCEFLRLGALSWGHSSAWPGSDLVPPSVQSWHRVTASSLSQGLSYTD